jgi:hypothetical protein
MNAFVTMRSKKLQASDIQRGIDEGGDNHGQANRLGAGKKPSSYLDEKCQAQSDQQDPGQACNTHLCQNRPTDSVKADGINAGVTHVIQGRPKQTGRVSDEANDASDDHLQKIDGKDPDKCRSLGGISGVELYFVLAVFLAHSGSPIHSAVAWKSHALVQRRVRLDIDNVQFSASCYQTVRVCAPAGKKRSTLP